MKIDGLFSRKFFDFTIFPPPTSPIFIICIFRANFVSNFLTGPPYHPTPKIATRGGRGLPYVVLPKLLYKLRTIPIRSYSAQAENWKIYLKKLMHAKIFDHVIDFRDKSNLGLSMFPIRFLIFQNFRKFFRISTRLLRYY